MLLLGLLLAAQFATSNSGDLRVIVTDPSGLPLRAVVPEGGVDPGREWWIAYAKDLARDLKRIKADPDLNRDAPPRSAYVPTAKKR